MREDGEHRSLATNIRREVLREDGRRAMCGVVHGLPRDIVNHPVLDISEKRALGVVNGVPVVKIE